MRWIISLLLLVSALVALQIPSAVRQPVTSALTEGAVLAEHTPTLEAYQRDIMAEINEYRASQNKSMLVWGNHLEQTTRLRVSDMATRTYYAHTNPEGLNFGDLLPKGSGYACENLLLSASQTAEAVVNEWIESPSHNRCLLADTLQYMAISTDVFLTEEDGTVTYVYAFIASASRPN